MSSFQTKKLQKLIEQTVKGYMKLKDEYHVCHRDIKLQNLLVVENQKDNNFQVKFCDFGLATQFAVGGS